MRAEHHRDLLDQALVAAAEALSLQELAGLPLKLLGQAIGGADALLYRFRDPGPGPGGARVVRRPELIGGTLAEIFVNGEYFDHHFASDPVHPHLAGTPCGMFSFVPFGARATRALFRGSRAYHEFYRPLGLPEMLAVWPENKPYGSADMVGLYFGRSRTFAGALRLLEGARPHLRAAVKRCLRHERLGAEGAAPSPRQRPEPHLRFGLDGALVSIARGAEQLLPRGRVPAVFSEAAAAYGAAISQKEPPPAGGVSSPVSDTSALHLDLFVDRSADEPLVGGQLELRLGRARTELSPAEVAVLAQLSLGLGNQEIAERLFLSEATVRTHVQRILRKLGVASRVQAALIGHGQFFATGGAAGEGRD